MLGKSPIKFSKPLIYVPKPLIYHEMNNFKRDGRKFSMNILVQGAGALGAYFGGRLLEAGHNVAFFVREKRAAQLKKEGLKITSPEGNFESEDVTVYTSPEEVQNIDLIIVAVKGYHLDQAIPQVQAIVAAYRGVCVAVIKWYGACRETTASNWQRKSARWICGNYCDIKRTWPRSTYE